MMRENKEILDHINERYEFWCDHLKRLKTSKNCDKTAIKETESILTELETIREYILNC